jgi:hypothetical protein
MNVTWNDLWPYSNRPDDETEAERQLADCAQRGLPSPLTYTTLAGDETKKISWKLQGSDDIVITNVEDMPLND